MVSKSKFFHLVVEEYDKLNDKHISEFDLNNYLKDNECIQFYAFIKHDKDLNDSGAERVHYHLVIVLKTDYSKTTIINDISSKLLVNKHCIGSRRVFDFVLMVQYLIHQNDKDKYQYDVLDVWCNDTNELFKILYEGVSSYDLDIDMIIALVNKSNSLATIYKELGIKKARTYRSLIIDLWKEKNFYEV